MIDVIASLAILTGLEVVLGIDNVVVIALLASRLPKPLQAKAAKMGIWIGVGLRIILLSGAAMLAAATSTIVTVKGLELSAKDIFLLVGGLFLIYKATIELHELVNAGEHEQGSAKQPITMRHAIVQMCILNVVFSLDSVITAIGISRDLWAMYVAVLVSAGVMMFAASSITRIIDRNPGLKVLALAFLVCIGITIFLEGLHQHIPKTYIYLPMGFGLLVELLQMLHSKNTSKPHLDACPTCKERGLRNLPAWGSWCTKCRGSFEGYFVCK